MQIDEEHICTLEKKYNVRIVIAKINGKRWSSDQIHTRALPVSQSVRYQLSENAGLIVYNWNMIDCTAQAALEREIRNMESVNT
jgi:hypothetical protein